VRKRSVASVRNASDSMPELRPAITMVRLLKFKSYESSALTGWVEMN